MLYFKIIDGQEVISPCTTLKIDGRWVSNPTEEQIFADGWQIIYCRGLRVQAVEQVERRAVMLTLVAELVIGEE